MSQAAPGSPRRRIVRRLLFGALLASVTSLPAAGTSVADRKEQLQDLQSRIDALRRDIAAGEESKANAADQLRDAEKAISSTNRRLRELARDNASLRSELGELDSQANRLERESGVERDRLARMLSHQFAGGDSDALSLLLAGKDPNQAARDRHFLTLLSRAKADLIRKLRESAKEKKRLADEVRERQVRLAEVQRQEQEQRRQLVERKKQRQVKLAAIAGKLKGQRKEIATLKRDEQRLSRLIDGLLRISSARKAPKPRPPTTKGGSRLKDRDPGNVGGEFAALRGQLVLPVKGRIAGRFGSPREGGGALWKGVFILAAEGAEIKSVADGSVVFSDWLRGFGNLLVIDHGDDFHSVYGNNESLLVSLGTSVARGQTIATAGNSGGNPDSGLYFELRHRGEAFDPAKWVVRP